MSDPLLGFLHDERNQGWWRNEREPEDRTRHWRGVRALARELDVTLLSARVGVLIERIEKGWDADRKWDSAWIDLLHEYEVANDVLVAMHTFQALGLLEPEPTNHAPDAAAVPTPPLTQARIEV
jgi:hypothetical protein